MIVFDHQPSSCGRHGMTSGSLSEWSDLSKSIYWDSLLVGNGASINVWSSFGYGSLYEEADLGADAKSVFDSLDTRNFEQALKATHHARIVDRALSRDESATESLHGSIRHALFGAVRKVHVPHGAVGAERLEAIARIFTDYKRVYSTNYDLLSYWSIMISDWTRSRLKDMFWEPPNHTFNRDNSKIYGAATAVFYLHGGIHLWMDRKTKICGKWALVDEALLDDAHLGAHPDRVPLMISEATHEEKLTAVGDSDYLRFGFEELLNDRGNLVVQGSSLGDSDQHIVRAIKIGPKRNVAIGFLPDSVVDSSLMRLREDLAPQNAFFFDASSHPLGSGNLNVG